ncbi:MAG: Gldg family protein [Clostridia bacterium]|nr:Gldg family protein [Clostridia bacterium]
MNANNKKTASGRDNRRYKYGSLSAVFTLVFVALVLVINLILSSLSLSGSLTVDLTQEDFTSIGEESERLLTELGKDLDITITFMSARDMFDLKENNYNGINLTGLVRDLAENYQRMFDGSGDKGKITVQYKELDKDPEFEKKYLEESSTKLSATSVIVQGKYHYRVLNLTAFFTLNEEGQYHAFNGEYRFTTAMLQSSISEAQVVTLTYGNGEPIGADGLISANSEVAGIASVLSEAGFEIKTANLESEEIDERTEILITYDPITDLTTVETDKITKYLASRNAYMVFVDSATPKMNNLQSMLNDNWGINYKPFFRVTDEIHSLGGKSHNINIKYPVIAPDDQNGSAAYQIHKSVSDMGGTIATAMPESVELVIRDSLTKDGFLVETVLSSYETAKSASESESGKEGEIPLMLLSTKYGYGENNATEYSYVALVGSTEFANSANLIASTYGNKRVILSAARVFGANRIAPDIDARTFGSTAIEIENGTAKTLTWLICTILPGAIIIMGIVVFFKRRHM